MNRNTAINRKRKFALKNIQTKNNIPNSFLRTALDVGLGVAGGGLIGAAIGRPSFGIGLLLSSYGYYKNYGILPLMGVGMMASNSTSILPKREEVEMQGIDMNNEIENAKARVIQFRDGLFSKLYLDKLQSALKKDEQLLQGLGSTSLDDIEQQLVSSAMQYQSDQKLMGYSNDVYTPYQDDTDVTVDDILNYEEQ